MQVAGSLLREFYDWLTHEQAAIAEWLVLSPIGDQTEYSVSYRLGCRQEGRQLGIKDR